LPTKGYRRRHASRENRERSVKKSKKAAKNGFFHNLTYLRTYIPETLQGDFLRKPPVSVKNNVKNFSEETDSHGKMS
jgi:hypothetical protein